MAESSRIIKTYMSFGLPVDPVNVKTLVDLDISYALASTLVDWSESRELRDGIAKISDSSTDKEVIFKIRAEAKWSDGTSITSEQVVNSFNRAKRLYGDDLKSLFEVLDFVNAKDVQTFSFKLNKPIGRQQLLQKLTEPMYGFVFVKSDGSMDLTKSSGPYYLTHESKDELELKQNPHWFNKDRGMAEKVIIRQPKTSTSTDQDAFAGDSWPNIISSSSLMSKELEDHYKKEHFARWNRNLDRIFFFVPSPTRLANAEGRKLFLALNEKLNRETLLKGITGYQLSNQFFTPGYPIYDPELKNVSGNHPLPEKFKKKPLELLIAKGRVDQKLRQNLSDAIESVTGVKPNFITVALSDFEKTRQQGSFDIFVATISVNDPNIEGAVSFIYGMTPPLIPNSSEPNGDFKTRIATARNWEESKRNAEYRKVFTQSVTDGCLLPLFHFSSIAIARDGIDLSKVPTTDETVAFSKVRFK